MIKWMSLGFYLIVLSGLGFLVVGNAQGKDDKRLRPMPDLPLFSSKELNRPLNFPCKNPGDAKTKDRDCVAGELLAIFNPTVADFPNAKEGKIDLGSLTKETLGPFLEKIKGDGKVSQPFVEVQSYTLPQVVNLTAATSQVCGQILLRIRLADGVDVNDAAEQLKRAVANAGGSGIKYIQPASLYSPQPNGAGSPGAGDDITLETPPTGLASQWARIAINAKPSAGVPGVRVAVLDTGVNSRGSINLVAGLDVSDLDVVTGNTLDDFFGNSEIVTGKNGHGTAVASIIANRSNSFFGVQGIAQNASIVPVKVCKNLECLEASTIYGTCYAASAGVEASVLNMSFGTLIDGEILHGAIQDVTRSGSLVVASAGNTRSQRFADKHAGSRNNEVFPARFSSGSSGKLGGTTSGIMLSVGAVTTKLAYADFATANPSVDLAAPGSWVRVLGKNGSAFPGSVLTMNRNYTGTSFAAAFVSGAAAAMIARSTTSMTPLDAAKDLVIRAKPWGSTPAPVCFASGNCGQGLLQVP
jgi:subtilisin family serine protease